MRPSKASHKSSFFPRSRPCYTHTLRRSLRAACARSTPNQRGMLFNFAADEELASSASAAELMEAREVALDEEVDASGWPVEAVWPVTGHQKIE